MNETLKRHIISAILTFVSGFALAILPVIDQITLESMQNGAVFGVIFVGIRAGVKALLEIFVAVYNK